ncbi:MAG: class I SAM-dependent methyltransferase [Flavobacteriales bacterium]|nr:class I SAM-dependent methyltransferase [Flavobacteriales bacterium]
MTRSDWFTDWFDSPYYARLYAQRDEREAAGFISALVNRIGVKAGDPVLDLACGSGRHAIALHALGLDVTGLDLSERAITEANRFANEHLHFSRGDMRCFALNRKFSLILNLFTSFGYFESAAQNIEVLRNVRAHLADGGCFVLDYFNVDYVLHHLVEQETIVRDHISFDIRRYATNTHIIKDITVRDGSGTFAFSEKVQLLDRDQLTDMLKQCALTPFEAFGDYQLNPFQPECAPRLILAARAT